MRPVSLDGRALAHLINVGDVLQFVDDRPVKKVALEFGFELYPGNILTKV